MGKTLYTKYCLSNGQIWVTLYTNSTTKQAILTHLQVTNKNTAAQTVTISVADSTSTEKFPIVYLKSFNSGETMKDTNKIAIAPGEKVIVKVGVDSIVDVWFVLVVAEES